MPMTYFRALLCFIAIASASNASAKDAPAIVQGDVCVYGGTSGGVVAAVQASRMGKRVVIVEPGRHLGGMTAGGLSAVDIGDPRTVGGLAREYFTRLVASYGKTLAWDKPFSGKGGGPATGGAYSIEPHVAEQVFNEMAREADVAVHFNARLAAVKKEGARLVELTMEDGTIFRAAMFVDATYEGDLMAKAGVSYTLLREGNAKYGETYNGIYYAPNYAPRNGHAKPRANGRTPGGQGVWDRDLPLDPYMVKGDPKSGLLPLVDPGDPGTAGEPGPGVQAYCFRLCLTTANDRLPVAPPADYDPKRYELVARFIEGCVALGDDMDLRWFSKYDALPNDKWDFNTATFGGNLPGASWEWPEASYARREKIAKEHENYHRGLLHFLATDARVPAKVREEVQRFGLPRDEFVDHAGWPHQLYIREGRRMVSDFVMTEHHTFGKEVAPNPIGLGSYGTDTHEIRRIVKDGVVTREGKTGTGRGGAPPYPMGYGAIIPRGGECENLIVTFALSASHTAFSSIRMEPVFIVTSQSAATAACLAIDNHVPVQKVDYATLQARLLADGQILSAPGKTAPVAARSTASPASPEGSNSSAQRQKSASAVAVSPLAAMTMPGHPPTEDTEPVQLAKDAPATAVNGKHYDLIVVGGTAGGVACAVRAAREGCSVLLVQHNRHIGGMLTNGLMQWDALYGGPRAPLFTELLGNIEKHYIDAFGKDSKEHQIMRCTHEHYPVSWVEPHVMERECNRLVAAERNITLLLSHYPATVERTSTMIESVTLCEYGTSNEIRATAEMFADATYEGDLMALAKVPYRVGREARSEYDEPHAGKIFCNVGGGPAPRDAIEGRLNIRPYNQSQGTVDTTSPFTADDAVQAFNYRFCVSRDPVNRVLPQKPANYNREEFAHFDRKGIATNAGPNQKSHMNSPILPGENHAYPEATWAEREKIIARHRDFALGLMWFLQNDESVSAKQREGFREWGLAKDEFPDNNHIPYEMYVREARRLVGRYVFKEQDNSFAPGLSRTPIMTDSIAITDWYMDSHSCTKESRAGYHYDGKLILTEESRPAQIPYRALLPKDVDNLLVPVCLSATHVAWGSVRLEPVWMSTGEAAGFAAGLAKRGHTSPGKIDADKLVRTLVEHRQLVSFFNDLKVDGEDASIPPVEYFATKGFFAGYDAQLESGLPREVAAEWIRALAAIHHDNLDPAAVAQKVAAAGKIAGPPINGSALEGMMSEVHVPMPVIAHIMQLIGPDKKAPLFRGQVCRAFYLTLPQ